MYTADKTSKSRDKPVQVLNPSGISPPVACGNMFQSS